MRQAFSRDRRTAAGKLQESRQVQTRKFVNTKYVYEYLVLHLLSVGLRVVVTKFFYMLFLQFSIKWILKREVLFRRLYFTSMTESTAKYNLCKNTYSHKNGNVSNLRKHLKTKHPTIVLDELKVKKLPFEETKMLQGNSNEIAFCFILQLTYI